MRYWGGFWSKLSVFLLTTIVWFCTPALAEKRVALVVGNSAYKNVTPLDNPRNDAKLMADTLRDLGFTLVGGAAQLDLDKAQFDSAVQSFGTAIHGADVALFFYAGHGLEVRRTNYLVPVGANPTKEADVDFQMVDANVVLRQMEGAGTKLNLVVLDACRNNPFGGRGLRATTSGLAQMQAPEGTLISFATQPGNVAQDGNDGDSPYTKALAATIRKPGLGIFDAFNEVGLAVMQATGNAQQPWVSTSPIKGSFYFVAPLSSGASVGPAADEAAWGFVKNTKDPDLLRQFIAQFPTSARRDDAMSKLFAFEQSKPQLAIVVPPVQPVSPPSASQPAKSPPVVQQAAIALPSQPASPCGATAVSLSSRTARPLSAVEECALRPKDVFRECDKCPDMVVVPPGNFTMGAPSNEKGRLSDQGPQHKVTIARQFAVSKFHVTFREWDQCVAEGRCEKDYKCDVTQNGRCPRIVLGDDREVRPVYDIAWVDAKAYVAWLSRKTGKPYRLLSEAEYEYSERAGSQTAYPWGSQIGKGNANCAVCGTQWDNKDTAPVGSFPANAFGLYDMTGNLEVSVEDCYHLSYNGAPADGSPWTTGDCSQRVVRGSSWTSDWDRVRSATRDGHLAGDRWNMDGIRVARTLTP